MMPTSCYPGPTPEAGAAPDRAGWVHRLSRVLRGAGTPGRRALLAVCLLLGASLGVAAAAESTTPKVWQTQTFNLKAGWSAIFSHVDASHVLLNELTASNTDILEIWRWSPEFSSLQFLESPDQPDVSPSNWLVWRRADASSTLYRLEGNVAYLVKLRTGSAQTTWSVKGAPVPVFYQWKSDGMNLVGFSTVPTGAPTFERFFNPVPQFLINTPIYQYRGGDLGPANPLQLITLRDTTVRRGEAFWVRAGDASRYYGRVEVEPQDKQGVHFGDRLSRYRLTLRNLATTASTVQVALVPSESVPLGGEAIAGVPTLLVRGDLNPTTLKHGYQTLTQGTPRTWTLAARDQAGSEITLYLGVHWSQLAGAAGALHGGILRITEDAGQLQYNLPVTARVPDSSGIWVGEATITQVQQDLKSFRKSSSQGVATADVAGDLTLIWIKRLPEGATPTDAFDGDKWLESAGLYYRLQARTYPGVVAGQELPPPPTDENGAPLTDPAFYWQARPLDVSFLVGYYFDTTRQVPVANGYVSAPALSWRMASGISSPPNGTFPSIQTESYPGALEGEVLSAPTRADLNVTPAYWAARPLVAPEPPPYNYSANLDRVTAAASGDVTVVWLKRGVEASTPVDSGDTAKWFLGASGYQRKFPVLYPAATAGQVLSPPATDETGAALLPDSSYWSGRPYHPAFVAGFSYHAGTGLVQANGTLPEVEVIWLPAGTSDPAAGRPSRYQVAVEGTVLSPPSRTWVSVDASHWVIRPSGASNKPIFRFVPSGDTYEVTADGRYVQTSANQSMAGVPRPMPLRLILHSAPGGSPGQQSVSLLQRVYLATDKSARLVAAILPTFITERASSVQRISSVHVPWTEDNRPTPLTGTLLAGLSGQLVTGYADPIANPFVHVYHPDHDNLDARYEQPLGQGVESYGVRRSFTLTPQTEETDFDSLARGGDTRLGVYEERLRLEGQNGFNKEYRLRGGYLLRRIVKTPTLLTR